MRSPLALLCAAAAAFSLTWTAPASAQSSGETAPSEMSAEERAALRAEIRAFLLEEPELLSEMQQALQQQQEQRRRDLLAKVLPQVLPDVEKMIAEGERVMIQGPADSDVTIIELTDYNCPYCRRLQPELLAFLEADPSVRHVVKALPYIGPPLPEQAIAAAAMQADEAKVVAFHRAMMDASQLDEPEVMMLAEEAGLDSDKLRADMESDAVAERLNRTLGLARALDIRGTPALILPDRIVSGLVNADELAAVIAEIRATP